MFSFMIILCKTESLAYLLSHPIQMCHNFLLIFPSERVQHPNTSYHPSITGLVGATQIPHGDNHLLTGLPAATLGLPKGPSQQSSDPFKI